MIRDAIDICVEEVALSGLEGAPIELIWIRLQQRMPDFDLTDPVKECIWQQLVLRSEERQGKKLTFYNNPFPIPINALFDDSYWSHPKHSTKRRLYIPPPNSWKVVRNDKLNLLGCCQYYKERTDSTKLIQESTMSYTGVVDKFGGFLTIVGSQDLREYHLKGPMMDPGWLKWTTKDYSLLEMVGKARECGIMRHILNTSYAAEQSGTKAFHIIKDLKKLGFLILEEVIYDNEGHIINGTLIRLAKYKHCLSPAVPSQNDKLGILYFLDGLTGKSATRKVLKAKFGVETVESMVVKGLISRTRSGDRACYKLTKPISQISNELMAEDISDEEYTSEGDEKDELETPSHSPLKINYHRDSTLFLQYYKAICDAGPGGIYLQELVKSFSINHLISRKVPASLENAGLIVSKLEDLHHPASNKLIRKYRLTAACYLDGRRKAQKKKESSKLPLFQSTPNSSFVDSPSIADQQQSQPRGASRTNEALENIPDSIPTQSTGSWNNEDFYDSSYQDASHLDELVSSEESNEEDCSGPDPPAVPLERLKAENGGAVFSEELINQFMALLRERFDCPNMEVRLTYLDPDIQARKQQTTTLYERRKSDLCGYLRQKRVVVDKVAMRYFLHGKDIEAGVMCKMDTRTLYRNVSQLQLQGYLHQLLFQVRSVSGSQLEDKIYLYHPEPLTSNKMLDKCQGLLIRMSDKLTWNRDSQDKDYSPTRARDGGQFSALPKFQKLRALHLYLYLLAYGHDLDLSAFKDLPYSWLDKVKKLPELDTHAPGWINTAIALRNIPFSLFYALGAQVAEYVVYLSEPIAEIFSDPNKRDLPRALINIDKLGSNVLTLKRGHTSRFRDILLQLYNIGAIEIDGATIPGVLRSADIGLNLEMVYVYVKPSLTLVDTCREAQGCRYSFFTNEARDYLPTYKINLDTIADLDYYWLLAEIISINSKLIIKTDGKRRRKRKKEEFSIEGPRNVRRTGSRELDSLAFGAAGFMPSLWSNVKRNWTSQCEAPDPALCYFDYGCRSLAYKARNIVTLEPKKSDIALGHFIPQPKLLLSQKDCLLKIRKDTGEKRRIKQRRTQVRRPLWSNMYTFTRANFRAPEEAGLVRKSLTRCAHWSEEESNTLLLCYITSVVLIQLLGRQVSTMVDIMGELEGTSKDKTTSAIRRHMRRVIKLNPVLIPYCDSSIHDMYNELKTHEPEEHTFKQILQYCKKKLTNSPTEVIKGDFKENTLLLPNSIEQLHQGYCIKKLNLYDGFIPKVDTSSHEREETIKLFMLNDMVVSSVSMFSGTSFQNYSAFIMFNKFSLHLLKQVVSRLKYNQVLSRNRDITSGDIMRYKIKFLMQTRLSECFPSNSATFEPQLIPYKLSDLPLYSDNPHSSQTLLTTLTEELMLGSPGDCLSLLTNLHSQKNNFCFDIDFPYKAQKAGEETGVQFPLSLLERAHKCRPDTDGQTEQATKSEELAETAVDKLKFRVSTSGYFGFSKTDVMKCADIITLAVTDPWQEIEFETKDIPPHSPSPSEGLDSVDGSSMGWEEYAQLVREHLHFSESDVLFSKRLYEEICREKAVGAREIELLQKHSRRGESGENTEVLLQNLVNFKLVMRAGTTEPCLIGTEFADIWSHPITGLDSEQTTQGVRSRLEQQHISCFRPWLGLIGSNVCWNTAMLNQLTRSLHSYVATHNGITELKLLHNLNGYCQLRHLRDILQTLVESGFVRRTVLDRTGGEARTTLFSKPSTYLSRLSFVISNKDPAYIFYESIPGKDLIASEMMLEET